MQLFSPAFSEGGVIPGRYTCEGGHHSPALHWCDPPLGTLSFVLIMDDPDAQAVIGRTFDHWVVYDIPATVTDLPENVPPLEQLANGACQGVNSRNQVGYFGPCPPVGQCHRYQFWLMALSQWLEMGPGKTKAVILEAIQAQNIEVLAQARLSGLFTRTI